MINSFDKMTVKQWRSFAIIERSEFEDQTEYENEVLDTFLSSIGIDFDDLDIEELMRYNWILTPPKSKKIEEFKEFKIIPFGKLNLADFIDLDEFYREGVDGWINCASILLRKTKTDEWGNEIFEPRKYALKERNKVVDEMNIKELIYIRDMVGKYLDTTIKSYSAIFESNVNDEDEEEDEETEEETQQEKNEKLFKWQKFVFFASDFDLTKMEDILKMNVNFLFNTLAMQKILKIYPTK